MHSASFTQHGCKVSPTAISSSHPRHRQPVHKQSRNRRNAPSTIASASYNNGNNAAEIENFTPFEGGPVPTRMNNIPHTREMRRHFYSEITAAVMAGLRAGNTRLNVRCTIPELNTEFDVYRVGTLLEMVRDVACAVAADGSKVKVCVQQALGDGVFQGTPLSLSGVMRIMQQMDWGEAKEFISLGNLGAGEVNGSKKSEDLDGNEIDNTSSTSGDADVFILISPQNITGHTVIPLLEEMTQAADKLGKAIILINPKLQDVQSSGGIMGVRGRQDRQDFIKTFTPAYHFRLLYLGAGPYPIMGALRHTYGGPWEVLKRIDFIEKETGKKEEAYRIVGRFLEKEPQAGEITECFQKKR